MRKEVVRECGALAPKTDVTTPPTSSALLRGQFGRIDVDISNLA